MSKGCAQDLSDLVFYMQSAKVGILLGIPSKQPSETTRTVYPHKLPYDDAIEHRKQLKYVNLGQCFRCMLFTVETLGYMQNSLLRSFQFASYFSLFFCQRFFVLQFKVSARLVDMMILIHDIDSASMDEMFLPKQDYFYYKLYIFLFNGYLLSNVESSIFTEHSSC